MNNLAEKCGNVAFRPPKPFSETGTPETTAVPTLPIHQRAALKSQSTRRPTATSSHRHSQPLPKTIDTSTRCLPPRMILPKQPQASSSQHATVATKETRKGPKQKTSTESILSKVQQNKQISLWAESTLWKNRGGPAQRSPSASVTTSVLQGKGWLRPVPAQRTVS